MIGLRKFPDDGAEYCKIQSLLSFGPSSEARIASTFSDLICARGPRQLCISNPDHYIAQNASIIIIWSSNEQRNPLASKSCTFYTLCVFLLIRRSHTQKDLTSHNKLRNLSTACLADSHDIQRAPRSTARPHFWQWVLRRHAGTIWAKALTNHRAAVAVVVMWKIFEDRRSSCPRQSIWIQALGPRRIST